MAQTNARHVRELHCDQVIMGTRGLGSGGIAALSDLLLPASDAIVSGRCREGSRRLESCIHQTGTFMNRPAIAIALTLIAGANSPALAAEISGHDQHHEHVAASAQRQSAPKDARQLVKYPEPLRIHTLANMRDHLSTMGQIQEALAISSFDKASDLAEQRLGMSSLELHGAHEVAKYMPKGMQDAGTAMHRSASQFAMVAKDAAVTGDLMPVLASLAKINQSCVACHAAYRLQ